jgi:hypothetical protein
MKFLKYYIKFQHFNNFMFQKYVNIFFVFFKIMNLLIYIKFFIVFFLTYYHINDFSIEILDEFIFFHNKL